MRERLVMIALASMLLMAGCHQRDKKGGRQDSATPCTEATMGTDTAEARLADTTAVQQTGEGRLAPRSAAYPELVQLRHDSAEIANLRIFARTQRVIYSPQLLLGEWLHGSEHVVFLQDSTGLMWDTSDDVSRVEAQHFTWRMDSNVLTIICRLVRGSVVPRHSVVTFVDGENLAFRDVFGNASLLDKCMRVPLQSL